MILTSILFYLFAALVVVAALAMVLSRNLVHSALSMAASFLGMAFIYLLLQADYMAVVQILVYVGAISVLFVFGIMLTRRARIEESNPFSRFTVVALLVGAGFVALVAWAVLRSAVVAAAPTAPAEPETAGTAAGISGLLLGDMALPLEATGLLLLAALTGAVAVARAPRKRS